MYDDVGDSAAWTGLHLAALAHEYNVTKNSTVLVCVDWMDLNIMLILDYDCRKILISHWMQSFF